MSPLDGIRVIDASRILAGPWAGQQLADLGAEVIKIEPPGGDETRRWGPPWHGEWSTYFLSANRGKSFAEIDLKSEAGRCEFDSLLKTADVLIENAKPGSHERLGLTASRTLSIQPRLIHLSITAYGLTGPKRDAPGYDLALQADTGILSITGEPGREPAKVGVAWIDVMSGMMGVSAILAALRLRDATNKGKHIDLALHDVAVSALVNQAQGYLSAGVLPGPMGSRHPSLCPYRAFLAKDGWFVIAIGSDTEFANLAELLNLKEADKWATNDARVQDRDVLEHVISEHVKDEGRDLWCARLAELGVPCAAVRKLDEVLGDPHVAARGLLVDGDASSPLPATPMLRSALFTAGLNGDDEI